MIPRSEIRPDPLSRRGFIRKGGDARCSIIRPILDVASLKQQQSRWFKPLLVINHSAKMRVILIY